MKEDIIGNEYFNNSNEKFVVIQFEKYYNKNNFFRIRFDSGYETIVTRSQINDGSIKDRYSPSVAGIGYLGNAKSSRGDKVYSVWHNMINRCYNPKSSEYKRYGEMGVRVCDRWLCFENFKHDINNVIGYDEDLFYSNEIFLDKDKHQIDKDLSERVYSLENCEFISAEENNRYNSTHYDFIAISPEGIVFKDDYLPDFCKTHSINLKYAHCVINDWYKTTNGWSFKKVDKEIKTCNDYRNQINEGYYVFID